MPEEQAAIKAFKAKKEPKLTWRQEYLDFVQRATTAGKQVQRVRVVPKPMNDYFRFEYKVIYPANQAAGEEIRLIPRDFVALPETPMIDFWLFDDDLVGLVRYNQRGRLSGVEYYTDTAYLKQLTTLRDGLLERSVPMSETRLKGYQLLRKNIRVSAAPREEPDYKKLAQALIGHVQSMSPYERQRLNNLYEATKQQKQTSSHSAGKKKAA